MDFCECKIQKGKALYELFKSWMGDDIPKPFDELDLTEKNAWVSASMGKKKGKGGKTPSDSCGEKDIKDYQPSFTIVKPKGKRVKKEVIGI